MNLVINFTEGAGFTGPTTGIILAANTFVSQGQHPRNVWPVLTGFLILFLNIPPKPRQPKAIT